ncbi:MAG TPA: right-handed parallel beta-helix repeat-containing protein, partial [Saprospiraceae bacterium]
MQVFHILSRWILGVLILLIGFTLNAQTIYYVNSTASPGGDGLSWTTALTGLQQALDSACLHEPAEIWVAAGTYFPSQNDSLNSSGPTDRTNTFALCNNVQVYGGFAGTETALSERDWLVNLTTLSGDLDQDDSLALNAYTVVTCNGTDSTSLLDGFTITAGNADVTGSTVISRSSGGGILISNSKVIIRNCNISRNHAIFGGGVGVFSGFPEFINCHISNNTASGNNGSGAGLANTNGSYSTLQNCTIEGNSATDYGGGFYSSDSSGLIMTHSMIRNNMARQGGGIHANFDAVSQLSNCIFANNIAEDEGGAINNLGNSSVQMDSCSLTNNQAGFTGGALLNSGPSDAIFTNCRVEGNIAFIGGGIYNFAGAILTVENSIISGNEAETAGGGLYNSSGWSTVTNSIISGNRSNRDGGGLMNEDAYCKLINCSITGNAALEDGAGIYNSSGSDPYLTNCILWNNAANGDVNLITSSIYNNIGSNVDIAYSLIQNSGGSIDWDNALGTDLGNNLDQDPLFIADVDLLTLPNTTGDFHLQSGSPVINAGTLDTTRLNLPLTDPDGYPRIVHGRIDMGAFEFQGAISSPECSISGPDIVTSYSATLYSAPAGMMSYAWSIKGNAAFFSQSDQQSVTIIAGASNSFLVTLIVTDMDLNTSICAINVNIEVDCSIYDGVEVIYVNPNATGTNSGTSWVNAFTSLQDALRLDCPDIEEFWVAGGSYYPTDITHDRLATFQLNNGIKVFGGFEGDELTLEERDYNFFITTLNGDIDQDGMLKGNVFNVVNGSNTDSTSVLDGFTIRGGNADIVFGTFEPQSSAAGMFTRNGVPTISNCHFTENFAFMGAGMLNDNASPKIINCTFSDNITGMGGRGGGMANGDNSSPVLTDCSFLFNKGTLSGGAISNQNSSPLLINCTFQENEVTSN